ncbi:MAG: DUF2442 domain-containing protein [Gammaproteobacteria bacterium HGW-Gammaproteobacteria-3]|nr:MAG: DUF2442 domain-containing protein [Gammaproteobacteria bacterium HGW-Gammaproteobacteria-3]
MNITEVIPQDDYVLYVKAEDGRTGFFDVKPYLSSEAFEPLKDKQLFARLHNGGYFVEWDCGADISVDTLLARWSVSR